MKKISIIIIFLLLSINIASSNDKLYYLDVDYIINNTKSGKLIIDNLKSINDNNIKKLNEKEKELNNLEKEISSVKNIISEKELKTKINNLKNKISAYRSYKDDISNDFKDLRSQELNKFLTEISPLIKKFMQDNSISVILDKKNIFIANSNYDITNKIIEIIDNK
jgi:outer membrane protein